MPGLEGVVKKRKSPEIDMKIAPKSFRCKHGNDFGAIFIN